MSFHNITLKFASHLAEINYLTCALDRRCIIHQLTTCVSALPAGWGFALQRCRLSFTALWFIQFIHRYSVKSRCGSIKAHSCPTGVLLRSTAWGLSPSASLCLTSLVFHLISFLPQILGKTLVSLSFSLHPSLPLRRLAQSLSSCEKTNTDNPGRVAGVWPRISRPF